MSGSPKYIELDGQRLAIEPGETVLEVAHRSHVEIPTLCYDSRLKPAGACRTCLVEVEGQRRLLPSCATKAEDGMVVRSQSERVMRHRRILMAMYVADHPTEEECPDWDASEVHQMATEAGAPVDWPRLEPVREGRPKDINPYIQFRPDRCIACARCTRYCNEVEAVTAISLTARASETTISTADQRSLLDTTCELCGGCVDVCPTGAMTEKMPLVSLPTRPLEKVRTTCNYCGVGCQMDLNVDPEANEGRGRVVKVTSPPTGTFPNDGNLCVKGRFAYDFIHDETRLTVPLVRGKDGQLHETSWEVALQKAADGLLGIKERHGADALGFVSSSRCTGEENYLVQKLARAAFGTNNCHQCAAT